MTPAARGRRRSPDRSDPPLRRSRDRSENVIEAVPVSSCPPPPLPSRLANRSYCWVSIGVGPIDLPRDGIDRRPARTADDRAIRIQDTARAATEIGEQIVVPAPVPQKLAQYQAPSRWRDNHQAIRGHRQLRRWYPASRRRRSRRDLQTRSCWSRSYPNRSCPQQSPAGARTAIIATTLTTPTNETPNRPPAQTEHESP